MCVEKTFARPCEITEEIGSQSNLESGLSWVVVGEGTQPQGMWWGYYILKNEQQPTIRRLYLAHS